jgi:thiol:disulfide interchange protein DsbD
MANTHSGELNMTRCITLFCALIMALWAPAHALGPGPMQQPHIEVELVAAQTSIQPGEPSLIGLRMEPDPGWHTYWINPGDSGLTTTFDWTLPDGVQLSEVMWPIPKALPIAHLMNYGYEGNHVLPLQLTVPADWLDDSVVVDLHTDWLVCEIDCVPGSASLRLTLPVTADTPTEDTRHRDLFAQAMADQPERLEAPARFSHDAGQLSLQIDALELADGEWQLFVEQTNVVDHAKPPFFASTEMGVQISQPLSPFLTGVPEQLDVVLVAADRSIAYAVEVPMGDLGTAAMAVPTQALWWVVVLALLGGVLLNLMPCVFPVLSIKALSLVGGRGQHHAAHGWAYTAGVMVSFALLAGGLLALRAAGEAIGWGFQLQSPWIIGALAYLFFALGLSLSGVVQFGTRLMGLGAQTTANEGLRGSFFTGVLACVVASPCTAPFMGTALGIAILLPWAQAMLVFLALGFGLALPMLALSLMPRLGQRLPRPGPWMETFSQLMAFPLYLAVVWLLWVLARQTDANGLAMVLAGLVAIAFALWLAGRDRQPEGAGATIRHLMVVLSLIFAIAALGTAARQAPSTAVDAQANWVPYSAQRLAELKADPDTAVLVNMTADWCVTCLVNERVALNTVAVREALNIHNVVYMKGDWTRRDSAITDYLAQYQRNGVPLYVVYRRDGGIDGEGRVLPQVLSPSLVVQALEAL